MRNVLLLLALIVAPSVAIAQEAIEPKSTIDVWPGLAPGEDSKNTGVLLPPKDNGPNPVQRVNKIRFPTLDVFPPTGKPNGTAVLILPGGGFTYVVPNLEGSEAASWLNKHGVTAFVLRYRTKEAAKKGEPLWKRPLQDAQRSLRLIRSKAADWKIDSTKLGVLGFSAGGQVSSILHTAGENAAYLSVDAIDQQSCQPAFSLLVYPWRIMDPETKQLMSPIKVTGKSPPAFIVHTHDDNSTAVGAAQLYIALKQNKVSAELHVYQNGGHGYGVRPRPNSVISTWPDRATEWLRIRKLIP